MLTDTHRPDGFRMEPFSVPSAQPAEAPSAPLRPAMRRLRPAEAVFVTFQSERPEALLSFGSGVMPSNTRMAPG